MGNTQYTIKPKVIYTGVHVCHIHVFPCVATDRTSEMIMLVLTIMWPKC